jgi:hypothetical protein
VNAERIDDRVRPGVLVVTDQLPHFVRGRASDHLLEGLVQLGSRQILRLQESQLKSVEYARLARKGGTERELTHGPWLGYQLRSPLWSGATACHGLRAGYGVHLPEVSLRTRHWERAGRASRTPCSTHTLTSWAAM